MFFRKQKVLALAVAANALGVILVAYPAPASGQGMIGAREGVSRIKSDATRKPEIISTRDLMKKARPVGSAPPVSEEAESAESPEGTPPEAKELLSIDYIVPMQRYENEMRAWEQMKR